MNFSKNNFTKEETNQIKGIALLFLLFHHLFYLQNGLYTEFYFGNTEVISSIGIFCKVCVGMFVFFSGYGLYQSQLNKKDMRLKSFYLKHFSKLYFNYWLIWLLFVPIGVFLFKYTFNEVYGNSLVPPKFIINFLGLQDMFNFEGYNPTWWFMTCILILYFLFPFLNVLLSKFDYIFLILIFIFSLFSINISFLFNMQPYAPIRDYLFTFTLGMYFSKHNLLIKIKNFPSNSLIKFGCLLITLAIQIYLRTLLNKKSLIITDGLITILITQLYLLFKSKSKFLLLLGKHSFNIFLFHTFIFSYYLKSFIYGFRNPILIFIALLSMCLLISIFIEFLKSKIYFYKLQSFINQHF